MKIRSIAITILLLLVCGIVNLSAAVNPSWYNPAFNQNPPYGRNLVDIRYENQGVELGQVQILINQYYYNNPNEWNGNYTLVISSPLPEVRLTHIEDDSKFFTGDLVIKKGSTILETFRELIPPDNTVDYTAASREQPLFKYFLTLDPFTIIDDEAYEGTYAFPFTVAIWVDYGDDGTSDDSVLIGSKDYTLLMKYITASGDGSSHNSVFTNLAVYPYAATKNIDIPQLETTNGRLTVGAIHFMSDDQRPNREYSIRISPGEDPENPQAIFAFHKSNSNSIIPYKVRPKLPEFVTAEYQQFFVDVESRGLAGVWEKFFELEISDINYPPENQYAVGAYTSLIQIQLIRN